MDSVATSSDQPIVSRADNRRKLEQIDTDVSSILNAMVKSEQEERRLSSKIVCAGVQMLEIQRNDPDAWEAFKNADKQAKEIVCKGSDWEGREVAAVLWRRHRASRPSRERISTYGKAIKIAHKAFSAGGSAGSEELLDRIVHAGGVKGVLAIVKVSKGKRERSKIVLDIPETLTLVLLGPDGSRETLPAEITRRVLIEMGRLQ